VAILSEPTIPVYLFSQLRFASRLPVMIALGQPIAKPRPASYNIVRLGG
jgi:hypothetical protein